MLREAPLEDNRKRELSGALHVYFKDWLYGKDHIYILFFIYNSCLYTLKFLCFWVLPINSRFETDFSQTDNMN